MHLACDGCRPPNPRRLLVSECASHQQAEYFTELLIHYLSGHVDIYIELVRVQLEYQPLSCHVHTECILHR